MVVYEFYVSDQIGKRHFIGLLPERRADPKRITPESISNFVRTFLGNEAEVGNLIFIQVIMNERTGEFVQAEPSIRWV